MPSSSSSLPSLSSSSSQRKLIILDLNGTLLYRPKHHPRTTSGLRPVHPRPYIPIFTEYLFRQETSSWLDVMVWSSAQPHSVEDMVQTCFGHHRKHLLAIWARDTLGLSKQNYNRKVQTVKDLNTPWSKLPSLLPPSSVPHSELTTLLLDDSPRKAELQPYNHVCLPEYTAQLRARDLKAWDAEKARLRLIALKSIVREDSDTAPSTSNPRDRKLKKKLKRAAKLAETTADGQEPKDINHPDDHDYDPTLLAVIGILEEVKVQANVAAWIRAGGLWRGVEAPKVNKEGEEVQLPAGNDLTTTVASASGSGLGTPLEPQGVEPGVDSHTAMWFDDPSTLRYWAEQGRRAVEALGLRVEHGLIK